MKHFYKGIILFLLFGVAIFFFGRNMKDYSYTYETTLSVGGGSLPLVTLETEGVKVNVLHGNISPMDGDQIRENITPVGDTGMVTIHLSNDGEKVKKIAYQVTMIGEKTLIESQEILALEPGEDGEKYVNVNLGENLTSKEEYLLRITVVTMENRKLYYYTRLKKEEEDHLKEKVEFVLSFQEKTMDSQTLKELSQYLEPSSKTQTSSLHQVTIASPLSMIGYEGLTPTLESQIIPTIKENNGDTASILLEYLISADAGSGQEEYEIREFFRVRYTQNRFYLLSYERTMTSLFQLGLTSLSANEFKLGIVDQEEIQYKTNEAGDRMAFVSAGAVWYYNLAEKQAVEVFSFRTGDDFHRNNYQNYQVQILSMDESGNMDFLVCGYMNNGSYEGRTALVLYHFVAEEKRIEEMAYLPVQIPFEQLEEQLYDFAFVNTHSVFFFALDETLYSYNMITQQLSVLASKISRESFLASGEEGYLVWQSSKERNASHSLTLLNLETQEQQEITAPEGERIFLLGQMEGGFLVGYAKETDEKKMGQGGKILPARRIEIRNAAGEVIKTYEKSKRYILEVTVEDNVATLHSYKKSEGIYVEAEEDYIVNRTTAGEQKATVLTQRVTEAALTEEYLTISSRFPMDKIPKGEQAENTVMQRDKTINLDISVTDERVFHVYAWGRLYETFRSPQKAIVEADAQSGVVVDAQGKVLWERGGKPIKHGIYTVTNIFSQEGINSTGACLAMLLRWQQKEADPKSLSQGKETVMEMLEDALGDKALSLTGCTLEEMLYFVGKDIPVMAAIAQDRYVLLTGYDTEYIKFIDPGGKKVQIIRLSQGKALFEAAGNVFYSYSK